MKIYHFKNPKFRLCLLCRILERLPCHVGPEKLHHIISEVKFLKWWKHSHLDENLHFIKQGFVTFFSKSKERPNTRFRKNCYIILPENRVLLDMIMSCGNLTLILEVYVFFHMQQFCATMIIAAWHDNLNNCLHLMILQDIHPKRAMKFSNDYPSAVTKGTDGQDGSQTNFGEIFFFLPLFTVNHKYSSQVYRSSAWKLRQANILCLLIF